MKPAVTKPAAPPDDPVRTALEDNDVRAGLLHHALAILGRRLAGRPAGDRIDRAGEALQETTVRALPKREEYEPTRPVRPWLHGILMKVLSEMTRALRHSPAQEQADEGARERFAADLARDAAETVQHLLDAAAYLAKLPSELQEILRLRFFDDLSHDEIAVRLAISPGNARVRLCRALNAAKVIAGAPPREERQ
jgi:RNA polymerase sigma factor (sigma-70 family)